MPNIMARLKLDESWPYRRLGSLRLEHVIIVVVWVELWPAVAWACGLGRVHNDAMVMVWTWLTLST